MRRATRAEVAIAPAPPWGVREPSRILSRSLSAADTVITGPHAWRSRTRNVGLQHREHVGPRGRRVHRQRQHVAGLSPFERAMHGLELAHAYRERRLRQALAQ